MAASSRSYVMWNAIPTLLWKLHTAITLYSICSTVLATPACARDLGDDSAFGPFQDLKTEPTFRASTPSITRIKHGHPLSDDHIIFTLRLLQTTATLGPWGPQIFDSSGNLVFYAGAGSPLASLAEQDPHICQYGQPGEAGILGDPSSENRGSYLCASEIVNPRQGHLEVVPRIYDKSYHAVGTPEVAGLDDLGVQDGHEFHMLPGGQAYISTVYHTQDFEFTSSRFPSLAQEISSTDNGSSSATMKTYDGCFREIDFLTRKVSFQWCYLDHFELIDTVRTLLCAKGGADDCFHDLLHINSVDKNSDGDYLVSVKFPSEIIKVAGRSNAKHARGQVLWRLGGTSSDFELDPHEEFFWQHHARFVSSERLFNKAELAVNEEEEELTTEQPAIKEELIANGTVRVVNPTTSDSSNNSTDHKGPEEGEVPKSPLSDSHDTLASESISLFDNHCRPAKGGPCDTPSYGKIFRIDYNKNTTGNATVSLVQKYIHPQSKGARSGGNMQILKNGNVWVGWGLITEATEFDQESGEVLQHVHLTTTQRSGLAYRSRRGKWVGRPTWPPSAFAYAKDCGSEVEEKGTAKGGNLWVSWNGATEVKSWRVEVSFSGQNGPWSGISVFPKEETFETSIPLPFATLSSKRLPADLVHVGSADDAGPPRYVRVTALGADEEALPHGQTIAQTWLPPLNDTVGKNPRCGNQDCGAYAAYPRESNDLRRCESAWTRTFKADVVQLYHSHKTESNTGFGVFAVLIILVMFFLLRRSEPVRWCLEWWQRRRQKSSYSPVIGDDRHDSAATEVIWSDAKPLETESNDGRYHDGWDATQRVGRAFVHTPNMEYRQGSWGQASGT